MMTRWHLSKRWWVALVMAIVFPLSAAAQKAEPRVELTPFAGFRLGGQFENDSCCFYDSDLEVDEGESFGLILDLGVSRHLSVELYWSTQDTELIEDGFFGGAESLTELDVDYFHVGAAYQWVPGQVRPFVVVSVGATRFRPDVFDAETRFSLGVGGGVKIMPTRSFGLRLEGRAFSTVIDEDDGYCDRRYCYGDGEYMIQGELLAGLVFAF